MAGASPTNTKLPDIRPALWRKNNNIAICESVKSIFFQNGLRNIATGIIASIADKMSLIIYFLLVLGYLMAFISLYWSFKNTSA